ncbi:MAG: nucleotidyltransferase family protein [Eubacterium sp.]|nr:nucleotidyltransferase family protein [Eubacterium sp.]
MFSLNDRETEYLLTLIRCAIKGEDAPSAQGIDVEKLLNLADRQQVYNLILPFLQKDDSIDDEMKAQWRNYELSNLRKTIIVDNERRAICDELEKEGIDYIFLKGLVIREYYPKTTMRQMGDNDILYDVSRRDDVLEIMKKNDFYLNVQSPASDDFIKYPVTIEFHKRLFNPEDDFCLDLNVWDRAERVGNTHRLVINKEDNYIHTVAHLYKHYLFGGSSIRFLCDIYYLRQKENYDFDYINSVFGEYNLDEFHNTLVNLCNALFEDGQSGENEQNLLSVILTGRAVNKPDDDLRPDLDEGKAKYVLGRAFPKKDFMKQIYPELNEKPYLLAICYIRRLFERFKFSRDRIRKEINQVNKRK